MSSNNADLIEGRIDFFDQVEDAEKLVETAKKLCQVMSEMPLLTTFRTHFEGGVKKLSEEEYFDIVSNGQITTLPNNFPSSWQLTLFMIGHGMLS